MRMAAMRNNALALKPLTAGLLALALTACGSGISTNSGSTTTTTSGGGTTTASVELGNGSATGFQNGALALSSSSISAGGNATVTATVVDASNADALYTNSTTVAFTSTCAAKGTATITPSSQVTTSGTVVVTYTATGCAQTDLITASTTFNGQLITATANINVAPATIGSIQFIGALPTIIGLQGMGGVTSSKVTFQVNDNNGNPVPGATVTFTVKPTVGGITLNPTSGTTDSSGQAFTFVQAGTQHTVVNVTATAKISGVTKSTQSSAITISTGIPTQNNFSMSMDTHNVEGWGIDGEPANVTVRMSDRFQNPVPANTAVTFTTNGGQVEGQCFTVESPAGVCSVAWTSKNPRPTTDTWDVLGHVHILAYTVGEESFVDTNGNGIYDAGEPFTDIPEVFMDSKETDFQSTYDFETNQTATPPSAPTYISGEYFVDFNKNGVHDAADGKWDGVLCNAGASCGTTSLEIGGEQCIVMSTGHLTVNGTATPAVGATTYFVVDDNGNVPAEGTVITLIGAPSGVIIGESGSSTYTVPDLPAACAYYYGFTSPAATPRGLPITLIVPAGTAAASVTIQAISPVSKDGGTLNVAIP